MKSKGQLVIDRADEYVTAIVELRQEGVKFCGNGYDENYATILEKANFSPEVDPANDLAFDLAKKIARGLYESTYLMPADMDKLVLSKEDREVVHKCLNKFLTCDSPVHVYCYAASNFKYASSLRIFEKFFITSYMTNMWGLCEGREAEVSQFKKIGKAACVTVLFADDKSEEALIMDMVSTLLDKPELRVLYGICVYILKSLGEE